MTKLAPEWVRTSDPVIRSPARYRWTTATADTGVVKDRPRSGRPKATDAREDRRIRLLALRQRT